MSIYEERQLLRIVESCSQAVDCDPAARRFRRKLLVRQVRHKKEQHYKNGHDYKNNEGKKMIESFLKWNVPVPVCGYSFTTIQLWVIHLCGLENFLTLTLIQFCLYPYFLSGQVCLLFGVFFR